MAGVSCEDEGVLVALDRLLVRPSIALGIAVGVLVLDLNLLPDT